MKSVLLRGLEHAQVDERVLVAREADEPDLSGLPRLEHRFLCTPGGEDTVRVLEPNDLVMLHQVDVIGLQPAQRLVDLSRCGLPRAAIDLRHQEDLRAVAVAQRLAHAQLAAPVVVVPAVVHEGDAAIDRVPDDADSLDLVGRAADMVTAEADERHLLARSAERSIQHVALLDGGRDSEPLRGAGGFTGRGLAGTDAGCHGGAGHAKQGRRLEKLPPCRTHDASPWTVSSRASLSTGVLRGSALLG